MKILFLQFRQNLEIADNEFDQLVKYSKLSVSNFIRLNTTRASLTTEALSGIEALVLGGSGEYLLSRGDIPEIAQSVFIVLKKARERKIPTLGICFGGQLMTLAFNGTLVNDENRAEVGTFLITKTEAGITDPLFSTLPMQFDAQLGHKDHFTDLPLGAVRLASSERSVNQAWTFPGEPIYALTFHPELDPAGTMFRIRHYAEEYHISNNDIERAERELRESPEANKLVETFFQLFVK